MSVANETRTEAQRVNVVADKRRVLLDAAVRVFARKGYHACRVADIAAEAGVAHGLLYHYFDSKEEVLHTVFRETWTAFLEAVRSVEESEASAREQLRKVTAIVLRTWRDDPDLVRVLMREVTRSPQLEAEVREIAQALAAFERIVEHGQETGEFRRELDPQLAAQIVYGALEEVLTGWVLGQLPDTEEDVARAERSVVAILCDGMLA